MKRISKFLPYLALALIGAPFLTMYIGFFLRAFGEGSQLGVLPERLGASNFSFLWKPIVWGLGQTMGTWTDHSMEGAVQHHVVCLYFRTNCDSCLHVGWIRSVSS